MWGGLGREGKVRGALKSWERLRFGGDTKGKKLEVILVYTREFMDGVKLLEKWSPWVGDGGGREGVEVRVVRACANTSERGRGGGLAWQKQPEAAAGPVPAPLPRPRTFPDAFEKFPWWVKRGNMSSSKKRGETTQIPSLFSFFLFFFLFLCRVFFSQLLNVIIHH